MTVFFVGCCNLSDICNSSETTSEQKQNNNETYIENIFEIVKQSNNTSSYLSLLHLLYFFPRILFYFMNFSNKKNNFV